MRYCNARDILPNDVLALVQEYMDGAYVYIPKKSGTKKCWGDNTRSKAETRERNQKIYAHYKSGKKVSELADIYFLSEKSIERIITQGRKNEC